MAFLGMGGKGDGGLVPIIKRAPATTASLSTVSAHLVQPKAVVRTPIPPAAPPPTPVIQAPPPAPPPPPPVVSAPQPIVSTVAPPMPVAKVEAPRRVVAAAPPPPAPRVEAPRPTLVPRVAVNPLHAPPRPAPRRYDDLAHLRKGVVLQARGEHAPAIEEFTKAIAADAGCVEAYASRAISYEALGDVDAARRDYAKSIEVEVRAGIAAHLATAPEIGV